MLLILLYILWRTIKPAGMFTVAAIIVLELLRRDFLAHIIDGDHAHTIVSSFLDACDILGAVIIIVGCWLGVFANIAYHVGLSVWTQTFHFPGIAEYPWERIVRMAEEENHIMTRRRQLHNIGAKVRWRLIWSLWLTLLVAWTSDFMHPGRRLLTPYYMGPWNAGSFLIPINQLLKFGWRRIIIHMLARVENV
ncbi:hypothetical protein B0H10DRAFT_34111 [Mycena sp. CBHHK59/15]|nr:hypothetical protein B0H10DRAFT_34111 [Mycena sp. CBHHK59/15]